ncbi:hypothetical protein GMLC_22740 [Geomonas limicola]|uniref:Uncharacterized protein n=1 Tax=Geomonas limicola TaxID=2740186 RepID=A0A6V8N809_9BACT|nr:hypothetical protein [Geomonas limicola]GFO68695.1 hypothetical protein GMLC_22740 [Geomonas limicola]
MKQKPLPNGRNAVPAKEQFAKITKELASSEAYNDLSASALRLLPHILMANGAAAARGSKDSHGRPVFTFTAREAKERAGLNSDAFSRAKAELVLKGFLEWVEHGGVLSLGSDSQGKPSTFRLSAGWRIYQAETKTKRDTSKAREARARKRACSSPM